MRRGVTYILTIFLCSYLFFWGVQGQTFSINSDIPLPPTIIVSQLVTVGWVWVADNLNEVFDIRLIDPGLEPPATSTLAAGLPYNGMTGGNANDTVTFLAMAPGTLEFVAVRNPGEISTTEETIFYTTVVAMTSPIDFHSRGNLTTSTTNSQNMHLSSLAPRTSMTTQLSSTAAIGTRSDSSTSGLARITDPTPSTNPQYEGTASSSPAAAQDQDRRSIIIGSVLGGVVFLLLSILGAVLALRRRKEREGPREDFGRYQDDRSSVSISTDLCITQGTQTPSASAVSCTSASSSEKASDTSILPLIPVSINQLPSVSQSTTPSRARTDRQMQIEQKIIELQGRYITASGSGEEKGRTRAELKERIEKAKELRESEWAYGGEGEVPSALLD
ncbi:hypothetical protein PM082_009589 [Marasmius tenuissimus]|nr:hypothetical protein PM082_009589 [Marasmius tenuissimus]